MAIRVLASLVQMSTTRICHITLSTGIFKQGNLGFNLSLTNTKLSYIFQFSSSACWMHLEEKGGDTDYWEELATPISH